MPLPKETSIESKLLNSTPWAFFLPRLLCYWPFTIRTSTSKGIKQVHARHSWNYGIWISLTFLFLNITYLTFYGRIKAIAYFNNKSLIAFDVYCIQIWDTIIMTNEIVMRIYCLLNLNKLQKFWGLIVDLTGNYFELSSSSQSDDVEKGLKSINNWAKRWTLCTSPLIIIHMSCILQPYISGSEIRKDEDAFATVMNVYLEIVMCFQNASVLFLIYFVKIIILGFKAVSSKIEETIRHHIIQREAAVVFSKKKENGSINLKITTEMKSGVEWKPTLDLLNKLEEIVENFNQTFGVNLLVVVVVVMSQVIFSLFFFYSDPRTGASYTWAMSLITPLILCPFTLAALCFSASELNDKCGRILKQMQGIPVSSLSREDQWSIQLTVTRLSGTGMGIYVDRLFQIRTALLTSAVSTFATYFIIIIQMKTSSQSQKMSQPGIS
ncbi:unnamed protein product [Orchesella dallaii]|uniref:Gustatory receptor n=1 Tax=Orchesella dallaii TaxID=48710 RepID=A0ABP1PZZ2_9HEXA